MQAMSGSREFRGLKGLKKQRRIQVIALAAVALIGATGLVGYAMQDGINYAGIRIQEPSLDDYFRQIAERKKK